MYPFIFYFLKSIFLWKHYTLLEMSSPDLNDTLFLVLFPLFESALTLPMIFTSRTEGLSYNLLIMTFKKGKKAMIASILTATHLGNFGR